ncbi:hypothetical protein EF847_01950 [Actinobacteria bacterium YIM 96077]|uniref:Uncharacterized protein n=1 Tax=Phytoactinopolyspora halophila TaxID=1981511 RepID=A0A329R126_9ACTN|nr:hypothetical protein [Phytoactinopolyspora halophila]AYY11671.1 hypothetical protein EF847_01950 [Actinobacteria bacterium YIM 96077]RAW17896.1 hypothetical protein DPM12_03330 [Phytoactinopolyspora halophila]
MIEDDLEPVVVTEDYSGGSGDVVTGLGSIESLAVDGAGRVVWTESFFGANSDGEDLVMARARRVEDGEIEHVAGASTLDMTGDELFETQASPPRDLAAVDLPLRDAGAGGALAAGEDGTVYIGTRPSILAVDADGTMSVAVRPGNREAPEEPFDDERDASEFGGPWTFSSMDVSGGVLVVLDSTFENDTVDVNAFEWSGDFGDRAQRVAEKIIRRPSGADGSFDLDSERTRYGQVAVVMHDGMAATAMAHVSKVALDDGTLYAVGETRDRSSSYRDDAEMLIVRAALPDGWR